MLHQFIESHRGKILSRCQGKLRRLYPDRTDDGLLDGLSVFLDETIEVLRRDAAGQPPPALRTPSSGHHGALRKRQGFDISRVVNDYGLLCDQIHGLADELGEAFDVRQMQVLNQCIDEATALAVESFAAGLRREQSESAGFVAHEIRNAAWSASLAFRTIASGKVGFSGKTAEVLARSLERIERLARYSLVEARLAANTIAEHQPIVLVTLLEQVAAETALERDISIVIDAARDLVADADPHLLGSALGNLVQNAVKFTRDRGTVFLRARLVEGSEACCVEVEDRCGGLPEGKPEQMFQPFVTRPGDLRGAGLGLAIARRAVEAHGGTLSVRDLPGVGCVFSVVIPLTERV
jgi:signal transduction histidine kinase